MAFTIPTALPIIVLGLAFIVAVVVAVKSQKTQHHTHYQSAPRQRYVPGEFSSQMELDLRLPYRRFKQLYPHTRLTYKEYKDLQTRTAFRRSMSSQENKRMVR